ncbi:MAG: transposase [Anaerolineae bacterium]
MAERMVPTATKLLLVEFLPYYSPDFNPIERLWRWLKTEHIQHECWPSQAALKKHLQRVLRTRSHQDREAIKGVMRQEMERLRSPLSGMTPLSPLPCRPNRGIEQRGQACAVLKIEEGSLAAPGGRVVPEVRSLHRISRARRNFDLTKNETGQFNPS